MSETQTNKQDHKVVSVSWHGSFSLKSSISAGMEAGMMSAVSELGKNITGRLSFSVLGKKEPGTFRG